MQGVCLRVRRAVSAGCCTHLLGVAERAGGLIAGARYTVLVVLRGA